AEDFRRFASDRAAHRQRQEMRDRDRTAKRIEFILAEEWHGPAMEIGEFKRIWRSLASHLEIDPKLMRPSDRVEDVMVSTKFCGPDSEDIADFFFDFLPHKDP